MSKAKRGPRYYSADETVTIQLTHADVQRVAGSLAVAATWIGRQKYDGYSTGPSVQQALELRAEILEQYRDQKFGGNDE